MLPFVHSSTSSCLLYTASTRVFAEIITKIPITAEIMIFIHSSGAFSLGLVIKPIAFTSKITNKLPIIRYIASFRKGYARLSNISHAYTFQEGASTHELSAILLIIPNIPLNMNSALTNMIIPTTHRKK